MMYELDRMLPTGPMYWVVIACVLIVVVWLFNYIWRRNRVLAYVILLFLAGFTIAQYGDWETIRTYLQYQSEGSLGDQALIMIRLLNQLA
jgi:type IV secretory pathway VirB3-like protein